MLGSDQGQGQGQGEAQGQGAEKAVPLCVEVYTGSLHPPELLPELESQESFSWRLRCCAPFPPFCSALREVP